MALEDYYPDVYYILLFFCFITCTVSSTINNPIESEFEIAFSAYRLRQFDQNGIQYGSRNYKFSYEAVSLSQSGLRRCQIVRWSDLKDKNIVELFSGSTGAVIVVLPKDLMPPASRPKLGTIEEQFANLNTNLAIYFTSSNEMTENLVDSIGTSHAPTAIDQIYNVFAENAFQISSSSSASTNVLANPQFVNIIGRLTVPDKSAPTIVIVAHYDSKSIVPGLSNGYDSNGSGLIALLSVMGKLSEFYKTNENPKLNTIFALTALGNYNYRGSRQLAEELAEKQSEGDRILLVVCLESLLGGDEEIFAHISKPLQEKTAPFNFLRRMKYFMQPQNERKIVVKTDIDADKFSWEHEAFFYNRISAITLSHFPSADHISRNTIANDVDLNKEAEHLKTFNWRVQVITETLVSYIFGLNLDWCTEELQKSGNCHVIQPFEAVQENSALLELATTPRPAVSLPPTLVNDLFKLVKNYCYKSEKNVFTASGDLQLYGAHIDQITAQVVKPALFELVLAAAICLYVFGIYHFSLNVHTWPQKIKSY